MSSHTFPLVVVRTVTRSASLATLLQLIRERLGGFRRGVWPRSLAYATLRRRADEGTFKGLILQRLASDRRGLLEIMVDKWAVRDFVQARSGKVDLPHIYQVVNSADELDPRLWPTECVVKPSHGSGAVVLISESKQPGFRYAWPDSPFRWDDGGLGMLNSSVNLDKLKRLGSQWLASNYEHWRPKYPEWAYRRTPPRILVEELIRGSDGQPPMEAKFHCFHGRVRLGRIIHKFDYSQGSFNLSRNGSVLDLRMGCDAQVPSSQFSRPPLWAEAVTIAEELSSDIDYVRVDLYLTNDRVVFSELTPYPN